jgi:uncharacterized protein YkwD
MRQTRKKHVFHLRRVGLFGVLIAAFFIVRFDAGAVPQPLQNNHVLAYATEMSQSGLLAGTNSARAANGMAPLSLNGQLNSSAQAKAQDMANKNYWAHVSPDGTQPWYFFDQAGYVYIRAGENLAYGFMSSQGAVDGWMNSPTHRANILGDYQDVGFGIVNAPDYQSNGQQTIVVAHYGAKPAPPAPAPTPAPVAPTTPTPTVPVAQSSESPENAPQAAADKPVAESPTQESPTTQGDSNHQAEAAAPAATTSLAPVQTADASRVSVFSMMASRNAPVAALASLVMVCFAVVGYALTHRSAFQHAVASGEHFVMAHPGIDSGIIAAITSLILLTTYGNLR